MSAPATLPKDFFDQAPQTLPADFQFEEAVPPPVPKTEQVAGPWDRMLAHTRETLPKVAGALTRFGAPTAPIPQAKMSVAEGREAMGTPMLKPSLALPQEQGGIPLEAARGVIEGIEGLSSADNAALLLGIGGAGAAAKTLGVAPKVFQAADTALSAYFAGAMGTGAYEAGKDAWGKVKNGDYPGAARSLGLGSVSSLFALLAGKHTVGKARAMLTGKTAVAEPNLTPQAKVPDVSVKVEPGLVEQVGQAASRTQLHGGGQGQEKKRAKTLGTAPKPQPAAGPVEPDWADVTGAAPEPTVKAAEPQGTLATAKDAAQLKKQVKLIEAAQTAGVSYATGRPLNALTRKAQAQWLADAKKRAEPAPLPTEKPEKPKTATQLLREKQSAAKALAAEKKAQDEAKAAELKAKIQKMPPAEVEQGISEAVRALPEDQLREVAAAQELPKPPKEGEPEALPPLAASVADELRRRSKTPTEETPLSPELQWLHDSPVRLRGFASSPNGQVKVYLEKLRSVVERNAPDKLHLVDDAISEFHRGYPGLPGLAERMAEEGLQASHIAEANEGRATRQFDAEDALRAATESVVTPAAPPLEPFRIEQGSYEPVAPEGENVRFRFTNLRGNVHEDVMPRAKWNDLASKGDPVAPAESVQSAPTVAPATGEGAPPALGSEPVASGPSYWKPGQEITAYRAQESPSGVPVPGVPRLGTYFDFGPDAQGALAYAIQPGAARKTGYGGENVVRFKFTPKNPMIVPRSQEYPSPSMVALRDIIGWRELSALDSRITKAIKSPGELKTILIERGLSEPEASRLLRFYGGRNLTPEPWQLIEAIANKEVLKRGYDSIITEQASRPGNPATGELSDMRSELVVLGDAPLGVPAAKPRPIPVALGGVAAAVPAEGGGAKQPWEMTREEWLYRPVEEMAVTNRLNILHKDEVANALREGKPVPPEVLAEYPDLAPKVAAGNVVGGGAKAEPLAAASARDAKAVAERKGKLTGERGSLTIPTAGIKSLAEKTKRAGSELLGHAANVGHWVSPLGNVLKREGDIGKNLMNTIRTSTDRGEVKAGIRIADIKEAGLDKLTREEQFNLHDALTGRAEPMNVKVAEVFDAARATLEGTGREMVARDITAKDKVTIKPGEDPPPEYEINSHQKMSLLAAQYAGRTVTLQLKRLARPRKDYYPQVMASVDALKSGHVRKDISENIVRMGIKPDKASADAFIDDWVKYLDSGERDNVFVQHLIDTGQAIGKTKSEIKADAVSKLRAIRNRTIGHQTSSSMEHGRQVGLPFYDPIPGRTLPDWLLKQSVFLERSGALGQNNEVVKKAVSDIRDAGGKYNEVADAAQRILGVVSEPDTGMNPTWRAIRKFQGFKLALSAIPNATQPINILLKSDLSSFLSGIKGSMTKEGRKFGERSGAVLENVIQESLKNAGAEGEALNKFLKWNAFIPVEKNNRLLAANAGRAYAQRLANQLKLDPQNKGVRYRMEELGLRPGDILHRGKLSPGDILMAAKKMSDITQFRARPEDLPGFASTPLGKVFFQFKNFSYNQGRLVFDATAGEFRRGQYGKAATNLLVLGTVFPLSQKAVSDLRNLITGREDKREGWNEYLSNIISGAALGLVGDFLQSGTFGRGAEAIAGPTFGSDIGGALDLAGKKNFGKELFRFGFRRIPAIGPVFSNWLTEAVWPKKKARRFTPLGKGF